MKIYVLMISNKFPKTHTRAGEETNFVKSIDNGLKIHTIRGNYNFWKKRFDKIAKGEAVLSVRTWVGKPYGKGSSQVEVFKFDTTDGIGIQHAVGINFNTSFVHVEDPTDIFPLSVEISEVARRDGLSKTDFKDWFKNQVYPESMAIIHFTKFRY